MKLKSKTEEKIYWNEENTQKLSRNEGKGKLNIN